MRWEPRRGFGALVATSVDIMFKVNVLDLAG